MTNAWTGGQYSLFRVTLGITLSVFFTLAFFANLGFSKSDVFDTGGGGLANPFERGLPNPIDLILIVLGLVASIALAIGLRDRVSALVIAFVGVCLARQSMIPLEPNFEPNIEPNIVYLGFLLLLHATTPTRPYGAWDARGRLDPDAGWRMPDRIYCAAWIALAIGVTLDGAAHLMSVLHNDAGLTSKILATQVLFAPLVFLPYFRPWAWLAGLGLQISLGGVLGLDTHSAGIILLYLFAFDPGWIAPRHSSGQTVVFYDGACGLCHRTIRFLLAEDAAGLRFRFAPLASDSFKTARTAATSGFEDGDAIPDAVMVHRPGFPMLTQGEAVLELGTQLGGLWRIFSIALGWLPILLLNSGYDFVARNRRRFFAQPDDACPLLPAELRNRFDN